MADLVTPRCIICGSPQDDVTICAPCLAKERRDPNRIGPMLGRLGILWSKHPDLRLGQLISNMTPAGQDVFYVEDDVVADEMDKRIAEIERK